MQALEFLDYFKRCDNAKKGQFTYMRNTGRNTKKVLKNHMTSAIQKWAQELVQMSKIDSGWALGSDKHIFNIVLNFL